MARRLNDAVRAWRGVRIAPMFGRWGYFASGALFACFPLRAKESDLWIRLPVALQPRALVDEGVRPHRRFAHRGWVELDVRTDADLSRALRWLRHAHAGALTGAAGADEGRGDE